MQSSSQQPTKSIFQTQPSPSIPPYERFMSEVKSYTQNLNHHIQKAFTDQNKTIKRKRQQLQKQLQELKQKFLFERIKLIEIEEHFKRNCQDVIKSDMNKWQENQKFFYQMLQHYQYEVEIQTLINERNKEKVNLLKEELKECLRDGIKEHVIQRLESKESLSKSKGFISKRSLSTKSQSKLTQFKLKTQVSQYTRPTEMNQEPSQRQKSRTKIKVQKFNTETNEIQKLPPVSQKLVRLKTDMSLPSLKRSTIIQYQQRIQNDDFNFMKPIKTIKKHQKEESLIPEIIKMFEWQQSKIESQKIQPDWFEKVVFNKRNVQKIVAHLQKEFESTVGKKKYPQSANRVKDLVAKNLFRLKTQSSITKNRSKLDLKNNKKSLLSVLEKSSSLSQQLIKF